MPDRAEPGIAHAVPDLIAKVLADQRPLEIFGSGGGQIVADSLSKAVGSTVPLLGQVPLDTRLREGGDNGIPLVLAEPDAPASKVLKEAASKLSVRARGLAGMMLNVTPSGR